ncbi:MAG: YtxH domain-containing protein [Acidobacteria bacterium]|jgi:gas vesicle protein|nr:YtxH domain-containing protein [Acidobacteriota bacterium]
MSEEKRSSEGSNVGVAVTFLLIGLGAGALTALLLAPKTGRQLRKDLRRKYDDAMDRVEDWKDSAEDALERGAEIAEDLRDRVKPLARSIRRG